MNRSGIQGGVVGVLMLAGCVPLMIPTGVSIIGQGTVMVAGENRSAEDLLSDTMIIAKVFTALHQEDKTAHLLLSVYAFQGHVFLIGERVRPGDDQAAKEVAMTTSGVKTVETYLLDRQPLDVQNEAQDLLVTAQVKGAIFQDPELIYGRFSFKTIQGNVFLLGVVSSQQEAERVVSLAQGVVQSDKIVPLLLVPKGNELRMALPARDKPHLLEMTTPDAEGG